MIKPIAYFLAALFVAIAVVPSRAGDESKIVADANSALEEILTVHLRKVPESMFSGAEGVAIVPNVIKVGLVAGVQHGRGIVIYKNKDGSWTTPRFISLTGGSIGWQIGAQSTDVILVFRTPRSIEGLLKGKFKLGADASIAAGPIGRKVEAATDAALKAEIYSYSRSRGLFAGIALDGSSIQFDTAADTAYYSPRPGDTVGQIPEPAAKLTERVIQLAGGAARPAAGPAAPPGAQIQPVPLQPMPSAPQPAAYAAPIPAPPPGAEGTRRDLARAAAQMNALLDDRWRRFLALPAEVFQPGATPAAASLQQVLQQYQAVATMPEYRELAQRPEFQSTYGLLQRYSAQLHSTTPALNLPPPPKR